jgi:hypothetical protein
MVLGNINQLCAGFIWRFGERKPGLIWALRSAPRELEAAF